MEISKQEASEFQDHLETVLLLTSQYPNRLRRLDECEMLTRFSIDHSSGHGIALTSRGTIEDVIRKKAGVIRDWGISELLPGSEKRGSKLQGISIEPMHWTSIHNDIKANKHLPRNLIERFADEQLFSLWFTNLDAMGTDEASHVPVVYRNGVWRIAYDPRIEVRNLGGKQFTLRCDLTKDEIDRVCHVLMGIARYLPKRWRVLCSSKKGNPRVSMTTDAVGVRSILQFRDTKGSRKEAIVHWVREHYRQLRIDPETETLVRKHLRGGVSFTQWGIEFEVSPSSEDVAENITQALRRDNLRQMRKDRRKRLVRIVNGKS